LLLSEGPVRIAVGGTGEELHNFPMVAAPGPGNRPEGLEKFNFPPGAGTLDRGAGLDLQIECRALNPNYRSNEEAKPMARKPNYEFERRERDRLKAIKNAEKAAAKKEAKERARAEAAGTAPPGEAVPDDKT
jgi:hypothetical protein